MFARLSSLAAAMLTASAGPALPSPPPPPAPSISTPMVLADACKGRDGWADPAPPQFVHGNTWYVGTCGITVLLITSAQGHVLIDGGPAEAAPLVLANIARLGFKPRDVRFILSSHAHDDHVGALAALQGATGAQVVSSNLSAMIMATGRPARGDPQFGLAKSMTPVKAARSINNGAVVRLGALVLTAHVGNVHMPGATSWTWESCAGTDCRTMSYLDSLTTISADSYRFSENPLRIRSIEDGLTRLESVPCGILITPHPGASNLFERLAGRSPLFDPGACRTYVASARIKFHARLAREAGETAK